MPRAAWLIRRAPVERSRSSDARDKARNSREGAVKAMAACTQQWTERFDERRAGSVAWRARPSKRV
jgi:hypothetical protein